MVYTCDLCDYSTGDAANYSRHKKTKKHIKILDSTMSKNKDKYPKGVQQVSNNYQTDIKNDTDTTTSINSDNIFKCEFCDKNFNYKNNYYRHRKSCNKTNLDKNLYTDLKIKLIISEKEKEMEKQEKEFHKEKTELLSGFLKEKTELLNNFMTNSNILLNKATDNTKTTAEAIKSVSMSAIKYANEKFQNTPALLPLENFNINNLDFDNENDKAQLVEILIYNAKQKSLDKLLGDHIVKEYKKDNPEEQTFHTTDCSRLNYIVRDLIENALIWSMDKSGIKICTSIVKPLIEKCINLLLEHQKDLIEEMSNGNLRNKETVKTIISVLMSIDRGSLESDVNKYIAPFFNLNKNS